MNEDNKLIVYQTDDGAIALKADAKQETVWATQKQLAEVFGVNVPTINEHIKNIFAMDELDDMSTIRKFRIVQKEGKREVARNIDHYNLDMIISVGYRVNSKTANLLYFIIKNHPFNDGNKRTAAFAFIWFLQKAGIDFKGKITPEALTSIPLLIADSDPASKARMIGLIILLLTGRASHG